MAVIMRGLEDFRGDRFSLQSPRGLPSTEAGGRYPKGSSENARITSDLFGSFHEVGMVRPLL